METWQERQRRTLVSQREHAGLNQDELAAKAGLRFWTYVRLEAGRQPIKGTEIQALETALGLASGGTSRGADPGALASSSSLPALYSTIRPPTSFENSCQMTPYPLACHLR